MESPFPIAFLMGSLIIFQGLTPSLIGQPVSFALLALSGGKGIVYMRAAVCVAPATSDHSV